MGIRRELVAEGSGGGRGGSGGGGSLLEEEARESSAFDRGELAASCAEFGPEHGEYLGAPGVHGHPLGLEKRTQERRVLGNAAERRDAAEGTPRHGCGGWSCERRVWPGMPWESRPANPRTAAARPPFAQQRTAEQQRADDGHDHDHFAPQLCFVATTFLPWTLMGRTLCNTLYRHPWILYTGPRPFLSGF